MHRDVVAYSSDPRPWALFVGIVPARCFDQPGSPNHGRKYAFMWLHGQLERSFSRRPPTGTSAEQSPPGYRLTRTAGIAQCRWRQPTPYFSHPFITMKNFPTRPPSGRTFRLTLAAVAAASLLFTVLPLMAEGGEPPPGKFWCTHGPFRQPPTVAILCDRGKCCEKTTRDIYDEDGNWERTEYAVACVECELKPDPGTPGQPTLP
jgi:hypothetical protein